MSSPKEELDPPKNIQILKKTRELEDEVRSINMSLGNSQNKENQNLREMSTDVICSKQLNKRLDQVESSILGIYKTLNLLEKMTEKNSTQLKHIIDLCNKRDLE